MSSTPNSEKGDKGRLETSQLFLASLERQHLLKVAYKFFGEVYALSRDNPQEQKEAYLKAYDTLKDMNPTPEIKRMVLGLNLQMAEFTLTVTADVKKFAADVNRRLDRVESTLSAIETRQTTAAAGTSSPHRLSVIDESSTDIPKSPASTSSASSVEESAFPHAPRPALAVATSTGIGVSAGAETQPSRTAGRSSKPSSPGIDDDKDIGGGCSIL